jgi:hypothetical protein
MRGRSKSRGPLSRDELVRRVRAQLMRRSAPRLQLSIIVGLAGAAALITSVVGLQLGIGSMLIRYPLAVAGGYVTFLILIRCWIAWQRMESGWDAPLDSVADALQPSALADLKVPAAPGSAPLPFAGGGSGGGGGGTSWAGALAPPRVSGATPARGVGLDLDVDELWPLILAAVCALGGLVAIIYVISTAPVLLAEIALDAAVMSTLYTRLKKRDTSHWAMTVIRRTWRPALALFVFAAVGGYALDQIDPDARSIGAVFRALRD